MLAKHQLLADSLVTVCAASQCSSELVDKCIVEGSHSFLGTFKECILGKPA